MDSCDISSQASEIHETIIERNEPSIDDVEVSDDLYSRPSIRVATRVKPDLNFLEQQKDPEKLKEEKLHVKNLENHKLEAQNDEPIVSNTEKKPEIDMPFSTNQLRHVLDTVENYEKVNIFNNTDNGYSTLSSNEQAPPEYLNKDEQFLSPPLNINPKPMTLQTFMRPQGKPMMNNMFYRRPLPPDVRFRRPGMQKPMIGMPPRLPPSMIMMQPNFMTATKKQFVKMPSPMNRPPINAFGRPPVMPMKQAINPPQPLFNAGQPIPKPPVILGKQNMLSQTLTLGQPTIIGQHVGNHVVKTQMIIPSAGDNIPQQTIQSNYLSKPGQIIMGKPMDNPLPLDQQMIPTKYKPSFVSQAPTTTIKPTVPKVEIVHAIRGDVFYNNSQIGIIPSDFINSSVEITQTEEPLRPAVNTGFKPDSVVIEGGFKPIIREPLLSSQDRITDYDADSVTNNRRIDEETTPRVEGYNHLLKDSHYEEQFIQSFEPMFIPSPPDRHIQPNLTTLDTTNKVASFVEERPSPVYVKPEETDSGDLKNNVESKKNNFDTSVAADKIEATYLPPENKQKTENKKDDDEIVEGTVIAYDSHKLSDSTLTTKQKNAGKLYSAKLSTNSELLTKTPQFGPFKGEKPSLVHSSINPEAVTKLKSVSNSHNFPGKKDDLDEDENSNDTEVTTKPSKLSFANAFDDEEEDDDDDGKSIFDLFYDGSENDEEAVDDKAEDRSDDYDKEEERVKREAHHTPDHTDPAPAPEPASEPTAEPHDHSSHDHDHSHHDHDHSHHDHSSHQHSKSSASILYTTGTQYILLTTLAIVKLLLCH